MLKDMKKILPILSMILIPTMSIKTFAHDIEVENADGKIIYYKYIKGHDELSVTYKGELYGSTYANEYVGDIVIPSTVTYNNRHYTVTTIGSEAFYGCPVTSVKMPETIYSIGDHAFMGCTSLTSIEIPENVCSINFSQTFSRCPQLNSIIVDSRNKVYDSRNGCNAIIETASNSLIVGCKSTIIPISVTSIGSHAFDQCSSLTSITIPERVTAIYNDAFYGCSNLSSVTFPNGITMIGDRAFFECSNLSSVFFPNGITMIGDRAFEATPWYSNQPDGLIYAGSLAYKYKGKMQNITSIAIKEGTESINTYAFKGCSNLIHISIPEGVKNIGDLAFNGCGNLSSITIPESVNSIGKNAFYGCSSLTSITFPENIISIGSNAFSGTPWYENKPDGLLYINQIAYKYKGTMPANTSINIKDGTKSISSSAFCDCNGLTSITIPESVTTIGASAFENCSNLTSINIPKSVTSIESAAFNRCSSLTSITIPEGLTVLPGFYGCSSLTSITIPKSVTTVNGSFMDCSSLQKVIISDIAAWCNISFSYESSNPLTLAHHLYSNNGEEITEVVIPEGIKAIGNYAFSGCNSLKSVTIPSSIANIGYDAFKGCDNVQKVQIPDVAAWCNINFGNSYANPLHITKHLFSDEKDVDKLVIPNGVKSIGKYAFDGCEGLTSIVLPNSIKSIGTVAFRNCINLYSVTSLINIPFKLDETAFIYTNEDYPENTIYMIATLYVPRGREAFYGQTDGWKKFTNIQATDTKFKLTYILDGEEYKTYEIQATEVVTPEPDPVKEGYIFSGWSEIPWYMPAEDVTVRGSFTVDPDYNAINDTYVIDTVTPVTYYTPDGKSLSKPQRGINILRMNDGTTRKVLKK